MEETRQAKSFSEIPLEKNNPFAIELKKTLVVRPKKGGVRRIEVSDSITGEIQSGRMYTEYNQIDRAEFIKIFMDKIAYWKDLSVTGRKVFNYILSKMSKGTDQVYIYIPKLMDACGWGERNMAYKGLLECYNAEIIRRSDDQHIWFINPSVIFNGDRMAFIQMYQVKGEKAEEVNFEELGRVLSQPSLSELPATQEATQEEIDDTSAAVKMMRRAQRCR